MGSVNTTYSGWKVAQGISLLATLACIGIALGVIFSQGGISYALDRGRNFTYLMGGLTGLSLIVLFVATLGRGCSSLPKELDPEDPPKKDLAQTLGENFMALAAIHTSLHSTLGPKHLDFWNWASQDGKKNYRTSDLWKEVKALKDKSPLYQEALKKIRHAQRQAQPFIQRGIKITWATGTKACTLIGIDEVAQRAFTNKCHALVATGVLLQNNIVPIAGEMREGLQGVNKENLSGVQSDIGCAIRYAKFPRFSFSRLDEMHYIETYNPKNLMLSLERLKAAILRVTHYGNLTADEKKHLKTALTKNLQGLENREEYLKLFDEAPKPLSEQQKKWLDVQENYPIVWASTKELQTTSLDVKDRVWTGISEEFIAKGMLRLGDDLNLAFAPKSKRPQLEAWLKERGLQDKVIVTSFNVARYLAITSSIET